MFNKHLSLILLLGLLLVFTAVSPAVVSIRPGKDRIVWTKKPNKRSGLYTTKNYFVSHGVSLNFSGMYYFGDADNEGVAFHGGFNAKNLSLGGGLQFAYHLPAGNYCNMRFSLGVGTLRGDNTLKFQSLAEPRDDYRSFHSWYIQPAVGVEVYPISKAGFYLYGGLALTGSIIDKYQYWYYKRVGNTKERTLLEGNTYGILPMIQLGLGYSWALSEAWTLSAEIMVQEGLVDTYFMNLDAFPMDPDQNSDGVTLGKPFGKWVDKNGKEHIHWNDGWFQVGITVSYRWRNCEECRNTQHYKYTGRTTHKPRRNAKRRY